jgi:hypothetical protein
MAFKDRQNEETQPIFQLGGLGAAWQCNEADLTPLSISTPEMIVFHLQKIV